MESPRVDVVFRLWQCDKENHGWREGPPVTVLCQVFDRLAGPSPSGYIRFERKKNTALRWRRPPSQNISRFKSATRRMHRTARAPTRPDGKIDRYVNRDWHAVPPNHFPIDEYHPPPRASSAHLRRTRHPGPSASMGTIDSHLRPAVFRAKVEPSSNGPVWVPVVDAFRTLAVVPPAIELPFR